MNRLLASVLITGSVISHLAELTEIEFLLDEGKTKEEIMEEGFSEADVDKVIEKYVKYSKIEGEDF
jgi:anti-sigma regulatory factor (Ser/Thr protein kinase)